MSSKEEVENKVAEFVSPLKVDKLKAELKRRGIDTTGKKADLVKRLQDAMVDEQVQGETVSMDPENGNQEEIDPIDVPDDSVHSTTEHQKDSEQKPSPKEFSLESPQKEDISEQLNTSESTPIPQITEMDSSANVEDPDNSEVPPDSTDKMDEDEPKPKHVEEPEEVLPPLEADTVDEDDADQTMELVPDPYVPPEDDQLFVLDPINSSLNFQIMGEGLTAQNRQDGPLQLLWAGGRANFGLKEGKFGFECRVLKSIEATVECEEVPVPGIRVGWSTDRSPFLGGTGPDSYAYDNSGHIVRDRNLTSYGEGFSEGDVITALINFENDPPETSFSKNGTELGTAHQINMGMKDALFPHISSRQFQLEVNFGATPFQHELPEGFSPLSSAEGEKRIQPGKRTGEEKELLCLIGLPGCGKTRWAEKYMANNESLRYTHVSAEMIQSLFAPELPSPNCEGDHSAPVKTLPYKFNIFDGFCKLAATKDRHFIIDTQSIFKTTQSRRMQQFEGFKRIAVIVHPFDNFLSFRQRQVAERIPRPAVLKQMKTAFYIPEEGEIFSEVRFPELPKDKVIKSLQGEPQWAPRKDNRRRDRYPPRGPRGGRRDYYRDFRDRRGGYRSGPSHYGGYRQGGGYGNYYGSSPGYSRGGYQPYYNPYAGSGGYGGGQSSYYGQGGYGGGGYGDRGGYYDRRNSGGNRSNKRARK